MRVICCAVVTAAFALSLEPRPAAWGASGHRIVARIAQALLTDPARQSVNALLAGRDLVSVATWADEIAAAQPATVRRHFVRIPVAADAYDPERDCGTPHEGDCVVRGVSQAIRAFILAKKNLVGEPARQEALKFLVHLVGDLHQPLNCADNQDQGGRDVRVIMSGKSDAVTNLHAIWESALISTRGMSEEAYAAHLVQDLAARPVPKSSPDTPAWALECRTLAVHHAYRYPGFTVGSPPSQPVTLDDAYVKQAQAIVERQLQVAGARLADLLNTYLASSPPVRGPSSPALVTGRGID